MKAETCGFLSWGAHQRNTKLGFPSSSTWQICMEMRYVCGLNSWNVTRETSSQVSWALYKCQEGSTNYSKESGTVFLLGLLREWQEPEPSHRRSHVVVYLVPCEGNLNSFCVGAGTTVPKLLTASQVPELLPGLTFPTSRSASRWPSQGRILYSNPKQTEDPKWQSKLLESGFLNTLSLALNLILNVFNAQV